MKTLEDDAFLWLLVGISIAFAWILVPFYGAILWGAVLAMLFAPVQRRLRAPCAAAGPWPRWRRSRSSW